MKNTILLSLVTLLTSVPAFAQDAAHAAASGLSDKALYALGAGIAISIAALGGALAQGKVGAAAMEGIARNPQARQAMFVPMIIGLALIESLVIYALIIAFTLAGKV